MKLHRLSKRADVTVISSVYLCMGLMLNFFYIMKLILTASDAESWYYHSQTNLHLDTKVL